MNCSWGNWEWTQLPNRTSIGKRQILQQALNGGAECLGENTATCSGTCSGTTTNIESCLEGPCIFPFGFYVNGTNDYAVVKSCVGIQHPTPWCATSLLSDGITISKFGECDSICLRDPCHSPSLQQDYVYGETVDKYYKAVAEKVGWEEAKESCIAVGAKLLELRTPEDRLAINAILGKRRTNFK